MSRAPFVMPKATSAFDRNAEMYDTTIGWRFVNPKMSDAYGDDTMPSTGENVAAGVPGQPRGPGRLRAAQPGKDRRGAGQRPARGGDRRGRNSAAQGRSASSSTRTSIRALTDLEALGQAEADRPPGRHRHRRQCLGRQRRRRGDHHRLGGSGEAQRPDAARPHPRRRRRRRPAADHGHRPGARDAKS